ncbi:hypothetical protein A0J57_24855 [Sphingobium sp. 22B]|nr:hypothetical protein A0J57_24855 [Sphingobium sp. 22B]OAP29189.1 hypothetical protein A8O16_25015 [Sphingobium sp. 20006FA]
MFDIFQTFYFSVTLALVSQKILKEYMPWLKFFKTCGDVASPGGGREGGCSENAKAPLAHSMFLLAGLFCVGRRFIFYLIVRNK